MGSSVVPDEVPHLGPKTEHPRLNLRYDLKNLKLTPVEGFILSRVDGAHSYEDICRVAGISVEQTLQVLQKLKREGVIVGSKEKTPEPAVLDKVGLLVILDDHSPVDPLDLVPGPDMPMDVKMRIIRLHRRLKKLSPHEKLGLPKGAPFADVRRAYYAASKELHPDRYYNKDIGPFRELLAEIFANMTNAFQQLNKKDK